MPDTNILPAVAKKMGFEEYEMYAEEMAESRQDLQQAASQCNLNTRGSPAVFPNVVHIEQHGDVIESELAEAVNANKITPEEYKQAYKEVEDFVEGSKKAAEEILKSSCGCQFPSR